MAQRRGNLLSGLRNPQRSSRLLLAAIVLVVLLVGLKIGAMIAGRSSAADRVLVDATAPVSVGTVRVVEGFGGLLGIFRLPALLSENDQLASDNAVLLARVNELEALAAENAALRNQLKLPQKGKLKPVSATIVARPFDPWIESAVLGVGTERGIVPGCAVAQGGALIGKISESSEGFSRVELLSSPQFRISAVADPDAYEGIARGVSGSELQLDFIRVGAKVDIESAVFTRGSEGMPARDGQQGSPPVPGGLLIGHVLQRSSDAGFLRLKVRPAADVNRLRVVTVYTP